MAPLPTLSPAVLDPGLDLEAEIVRLRRERDAVILAHYYQDGEIQDLADHLGDSLQLAQAAQRTTARVIVFCGVHFMAETAKILNPDRTVVVPDLKAGCSLADSCPAEALRAWKALHPDHVVVSYVNCSAATKAESDIICTSSNARRVIDSIPKERPILFAPDRNLGRWLMEQCGREMLLWQGTCVVHETFSERKLVALQVEHPEAEVIAHPECEAGVLARAHVVGSTSALLEWTRRSAASTFIVATEVGILHQMEKASPQKRFLPLPPEAGCACNECPYMKLNTLEKLYLCLADLRPAIEIDPALAERARRPIQRMLALG
jgi:quinolinate synthase